MNEFESIGKISANMNIYVKFLGQCHPIFLLVVVDTLQLEVSEGKALMKRWQSHGNFEER